MEYAVRTRPEVYGQFATVGGRSRRRLDIFSGNDLGQRAAMDHHTRCLLSIYSGQRSVLPEWIGEQSDETRGFLQSSRPQSAFPVSAYEGNTAERLQLPGSGSDRHRRQKLLLGTALLQHRHVAHEELHAL